MSRKTKKQSDIPQEDTEIFSGEGFSDDVTADEAAGSVKNETGVDAEQTEEGNPKKIRKKIPMLQIRSKRERKAEKKKRREEGAGPRKPRKKKIII